MTWPLKLLKLLALTLAAITPTHEQRNLTKLVRYLNSNLAKSGPKNRLKTCQDFIIKTALSTFLFDNWYQPFVWLFPFKYMRRI